MFQDMLRFPCVHSPKAGAGLPRSRSSHVVSHALPHLGADPMAPPFQTGSAFERAPAWHGASKKSVLLSGELVILHASPPTFEGLVWDTHTLTFSGDSVPRPLRPLSGGRQPFFNYTFLHFQKRMLACVSQKWGDGCHRSATVRDSSHRPRDQSGATSGFAPLRRSPAAKTAPS